MFPVALSLARQHLAALVDSRRAPVQLRLVIEMAPSRSVFTERAHFTVVIGLLHGANGAILD